MEWHSSKQFVSIFMKNNVDLVLNNCHKCFFHQAIFCVDSHNNSFAVNCRKTFMHLMQANQNLENMVRLHPSFVLVRKGKCKKHITTYDDC